MDATKTSSCGYIIEFNRDTGSGFIQEDVTQQVLFVRFSSFKKHSKRYLRSDNSFSGELFDFDIIVKHESDNDAIHPLEAVNVRHRVLKCNIDGCSRIKAFTNAKALEDHINTIHALRKKKEEILHSSSISTNKPKEKRPPRTKSSTVNLSFHVTSATIGRFIGKQGINLKLFQRRNQVKIQLLNTRKAFNLLQILIKPNIGAEIDIKSVIKRLKSEWERCVRDQQMHEAIWKERMKLQHLSRKQSFPEFISDQRHRTNFMSHAAQLKQQEMLVRRRCRQTESSVRVEERHSSLNQEGHRSAATCDSESRQKSIFNYFRPKRIKRSMKEKQWLLREQLQELERLSV